jgi:hypothetical protein
MPELRWACELFATVQDFTGCDCNCEIDVTDPEHLAVVEAALYAASDELAILSGHQVRGVCTETVTVCLERCACEWTCGCRWNPIILPGQPVQSVTSIEFDGYTFVDTDFVIVDSRGVAWARDVDHSWPWGEDVTIAYGFGSPIDEIAKRAALEVACPVVKRCLTTMRSFGQGVQAVQREGINIARRDVSTTADITERAASDNPWLAKFLALYNPTRSNFPASAYSPDMDEIHVIRSLS